MKIDDLWCHIFYVHLSGVKVKVRVVRLECKAPWICISATRGCLLLMC